MCNRPCNDFCGDFRMICDCGSRLELETGSFSIHSEANCGEHPRRNFRRDYRFGSSLGTTQYEQTGSVLVFPKQGARPAIEQTPIQGPRTESKKVLFFDRGEPRALSQKWSLSQINPYICRFFDVENFTIMKAGWASGLGRTCYHYESLGKGGRQQE